jgi:hypothetical protein
MSLSLEVAAKKLQPTFHGANTVGPFSGNTLPPNGSGLYGRISAMGNMVFAYYRQGRGWGLFSDDPKQAENNAMNRGKYSKKQLPWFGFVKP